MPPTTAHVANAVNRPKAVAGAAPSLWTESSVELSLDEVPLLCAALLDELPMEELALELWPKLVSEAWLLPPSSPWSSTA